MSIYSESSGYITDRSDARYAATHDTDSVITTSSDPGLASDWVASDVDYYPSSSKRVKLDITESEDCEGCALRSRDDSAHKHSRCMRTPSACDGCLKDILLDRSVTFLFEHSECPFLYLRLNKEDISFSPDQARYFRHGVSVVTDFFDDVSSVSCSSEIEPYGKKHKCITEEPACLTHPDAACNCYESYID